MNDQKSIAGPVNSAMASANEVGTLSEHFREGTDFESMEILPIQFNLSVGAVDDPLEREANTVADHVMRMPEKPFIQRCACEEEKIARKPISSTITPFIQTKSSGAGVASESVTSQINSSRGSGNGMDTGTRSFMENRFGTDFGNVKIHTDSQSSHLNRELNAKAFTVGNDIYFNSGKYSPQSESGKHLLAHELTHVVQQNYSQPHSISSNKSDTMISRFTDTNHHIIENAALSGAGFTEEQIEQIERGNVERDYSQAPGLVNFALLCENRTYSGYQAEDHFDNYIWNPQLNKFEDRWKGESRNIGITNPLHLSNDPIRYIKDNIMAVIESGINPVSLNRLGAAFHAVEDFFAHSNFVNLLHNDTTHGTQLLTGSNDDGASEFATAYTLNAVSPPQHPMFPRSYLNQIHEDAIGLSHSRISKDYTSDQYHYEARRLAALVVQKLSRQILYIMEYDDIERRREATIVSVFTLIDSYLSPPDPSVFAWWEFLQNEDNGAIDALLSRAEQRTPVTVNQCMWSPLVGLEATRHSSVRTFGMFNPAIGAVRLGLASLTGGDINDILIGAIPSATFQFNIGNSRAALSIGGLTNIPFGRLNTLIQDESNYFPESQIRNRSAPEDKPFSSVGVTFNLSLE